MALITLLLLALTFGVISFIKYHKKRLGLYRAAAKMSGPRTYPLIGNAHYFFGNTVDIMNRVIKLLDIYPTPARIWLGSKLCIAISDPEQMKVVFLSPKTIEKGDVYHFVRPWLGTGLLLAPAAKWRTHRKLIMPTFNPRILETFIDVFVQQSYIMTKEMEVELHGEEFDVFDYISRCTLDMICETAIGVRGEAQMKRSSPYLDSAKTMLEIVYLRMFKLWLHSDIIFNWTSLGREHEKCLKYLHSHTDNVIQTKRAELDCSQHIRINGTTELTKPRRKAFMDLLMELSDGEMKFTDQELREEVDTIIFGGNDTSATINTFVIYMLANFPDIQEKCYDELCNIFGDKINSTTSITREDIRRMEYLERVIKETMRLFPVGPFLMRNVTDDLVIGEYTLPKGSSVILLVMKLHRCPNIWINPLEFNPDRFLPEQVGKRHPYSYVPFSAGPRNCIGLQYAMMSMKVLIATVLRKYSLHKDSKVEIEQIKLKVELVMKPARPITVRISKRY